MKKRQRLYFVYGLRGRNEVFATIKPAAGVFGYVGMKALAGWIVMYRPL